MENFLTGLLWVAFGAASAYYAKKQKRNPYLWFFVGLSLGIFGLLSLLILSLVQKLRQGSQAKKQAQASSVSKPEIAVSLTVDKSFSDTLWYYVDEASIQKGPMSFTAFERDWKEGKFLPSSFVWNEKLTEWKVFKELFPSAEKELSK